MAADKPALELEEYRDPNGRVPFAEWLEGLRDAPSRARILKLLNRLRTGLWGDVKAVGEGVSELREDHGPGFRLYVAGHGETLVILLVGEDKATQKRDIERAKRYWQDWKARSGK